MKKIIVSIGFFLFAATCQAQLYVYDANHFNIIMNNGTARLAAEMTYQSSLENIHKNTDDINLNLTSVTLVQHMIHRSLTEINQTLREGLQVKQMGYLTADIIKNSNAALALAQGDPALLLFAEKAAGDLKQRSLGLVGDVSSVVLARDKHVLLNYNVRDELIKNVIEQLQIMNAIIYTIRQNMYYARARGLIHSLNPFQDYINQDLALERQVLFKRKLLKR